MVAVLDQALDLLPLGHAEREIEIHVAEVVVAKGRQLLIAEELGQKLADFGSGGSHVSSWALRSFRTQFTIGRLGGQRGELALR